jgi:hypothetical protein
MRTFWDGFEKRARDPFVALHGRAFGKPDKLYPKKELVQGEKHELEHTDNPRLSKQIAKDHLAEDKRYYTHLGEAKLAFWNGFTKQAEDQPSLISDWIKEDKEARQQAVKDSKVETKVDPRQLSEWQGPEAWYRFGSP